MVREKQGSKVEVQLGFLQVALKLNIAFKLKNKLKFNCSIPDTQVHHVYEVVLLLGRDKFPGELSLYGQIDAQVIYVDFHLLCPMTRLNDHGKEICYPLIH